MRVLALLLCLALGLTFAEPYARLSVVPTGEQVFDLASGVSTLPEGGEIRDAERDLRVLSPYIRYLEGRFVEARDAVATGAFGRLEAATLYFDLATGELLASGGLKLEYEGLVLEAADLALYLEDGVARLAGGVRSSAPAFEAEALLLPLDGGGALLVSPYRYTQPPLALEQPRAGELLQLMAETGPDGSRRYIPSTTVGDAVLTSLSPYLPQ